MAKPNPKNEFASELEKILRDLSREIDQAHAQYEDEVREAVTDLNRRLSPPQTN